MRIVFPLVFVLSLPSVFASPLESIQPVFSLLKGWFENDDIRFVAMLFLITYLTFRIIITAPFIREHKPLKNAAAIMAFGFFPVWAFSDPFF